MYLSGDRVNQVDLQCILLVPFKEAALPTDSYYTIKLPWHE